MSDKHFDLTNGATGQTSEHLPHAVHSFSSTYLAFLRTVTLKLPTNPVTESISLWLRSSMLGCRPASIILGPKIHMEQSIVG